MEDKLDRFSGLEPEWNELQRNRDLLETNIRTLAEQEQREGTVAGITTPEADSVKVTEPATIPLEGSSLKLPVALLAFLFAGFTALIAGLFKAVTRPGFATRGSFQRTTGVPVLAAAGRI